MLTKENWRMSTCNRLDLQTIGSQPVVTPKNFADHRHVQSSLYKCYPYERYNFIYVKKNLLPTKTQLVRLVNVMC